MAAEDITAALTQIGELFGSLSQQLKSLAEPLANVSTALKPLGEAINSVLNPIKQFASTLQTGVLGMLSSLVAGGAELAAGLAGLTISLLSAAASATADAVAELMEAAAATAAALAEFTVSAVLSGGVTVALLALAAALAAAVAAIAAAAAALVAALAAVAAAIVAVFAAPLIAAATMLTAAFAAAAAPFAAAGAAASAAVAPFLALGAAAQAVTAPFQMLSSAIGPFVQALNPSAMELFNYSLRTLQATIGVAFLPVINAMSAAMRQFAGALLPATQALGPILGQLAATLAGIMLPILQTVSDLFVAFAPILQFIADLLSAMGESFRVMAVVARTLVQTFVELIAAMFGKGDLKDVAAKFRTALQEMTLAVIKLVAFMAKAFGQNDFLDKLIRNLNAVANPASGAAPAATNVSTKSFEQIGLDIAKAAFTAQAAGGPKQDTEVDFLKRMVDQLEAMKTNSATLQQIFEAVGGDIETALERLGDSLKQKFLDSLAEWWSKTKGQFHIPTAAEIVLALKQIGFNPFHI